MTASINSDILAKKNATASSDCSVEADKLPPRATVYVADLGRSANGEKITGSVAIGGPTCGIFQEVWPEYLDDDPAPSSNERPKPNQTKPSEEPETEFRRDPIKHITDVAEEPAEALLLRQVAELDTYFKRYVDIAAVTLDPFARMAFIDTAIKVHECSRKTVLDIKYAKNKGRQEVIVRQQKEEPRSARVRRSRSDPREVLSLGTAKGKAHA